MNITLWFYPLSGVVQTPVIGTEATFTTLPRLTQWKKQTGRLKQQKANVNDVKCKCPKSNPILQKANNRTKQNRWEQIHKNLGEKKTKRIWGTPRENGESEEHRRHGADVGKLNGRTNKEWATGFNTNWTKEGMRCRRTDTGQCWGDWRETGGRGESHWGGAQEGSRTLGAQRIKINEEIINPKLKPWYNVPSKWISIWICWIRLSLKLIFYKMSYLMNQ